MFDVKVVKVPGVVKEVKLDETMTVGAVLDLAGITLTDEYGITVNDNKADSSTPVSGNAEIVLSKNIKGGC